MSQIERLIAALDSLVDGEISAPSQCWLRRGDRAHFLFARALSAAQDHQEPSLPWPRRRTVHALGELGAYFNIDLPTSAKYEFPRDAEDSCFAEDAVRSASVARNSLWLEVRRSASTFF